jgi:hypothetical protein
MKNSTLIKRARSIVLSAKRNLTPEDVREMREIEQERLCDLKTEAELDRIKNETTTQGAD